MVRVPEASQIATIKTTCAQFQQPSPTAATRGEAELRIYNLKKISPPQSRSQAVVCVSTPRKYPRSGYFLVFTIWMSFKHRLEKIFVVNITLLNVVLVCMILSLFQ